MRAKLLLPGLLFPLLLAAAGPASAQLLEPTFDKASKFWIEDKEKHCWAANPVPAPNETISWSGPDCGGALIAGEGVLTWTLMGKVIGRDTGNFRNGMLSGKGKLEFESGAYFEGEFPGRGVVTLPNGDKLQAQTIPEIAGWTIEELPPTTVP